MILQTYGRHQERKHGEILIGWFTREFFNEYIVWNTKRIGDKRKNNGDGYLQYPVFIQREEAERKGWSIHFIN